MAFCLTDGRQCGGLQNQSKFDAYSVEVSVELKISSIYPAGTYIDASENRELGETGKE